MERVPAAAGSFAQRPFANLLVYALEKRLTGTFELEGPAVRGVVVVKDGIPSKARVAGAGGGVREQLDALFGASDETRFTYYDAHDGLPSVPATPVDPLTVVWRGLRRNPPWAHVHATLTKVGDQKVRLVGSGETSRLQLDADESRVAALLGERAHTVFELASTGTIPPGRVQTLVYVLLITRMADVGDNIAPPPPSTLGRVALKKTSFGGVAEEETNLSFNDPRAAHTPPPSRSPVQHTPPLRTPQPSSSGPALDRDAVTKRAAAIDREDYFTMLGVTREASTSEVQNAFFQLAKTWHPDRLPPTLADQRDACSRVFARLGEAHATLTDLEKRAKYTKILDESSAGHDEQQKVAEVVEAATTFQKAEIFAKRGELAKAETLARRAAMLDPGQADYIALLAWCEGGKEGAKPEDVSASIAALSRAIEMNARCERAFFYRGLLYKKAGATSAAVRDFKEAAALNPRNVDAQREVRLFQLRAGKKPESKEKDDDVKAEKTPKPKPGFLQKLFKK